MKKNIKKVIKLALAIIGLLAFGVVGNTQAFAEAEDWNNCPFEVVKDQTHRHVLNDRTFVHVVLTITVPNEDVWKVQPEKYLIGFQKGDESVSTMGLFQQRGILVLNKRVTYSFQLYGILEVTGTTFMDRDGVSCFVEIVESGLKPKPADPKTVS